VKESKIPLIPRRVLFGNPDHQLARLSPDGRWLAWLAPENGVLNVWVAPRADVTAARPVTHDTGRGIRYYLWTYSPSRLLYIQDKNGDENWRLYGVEIESGATKDLTPFEKTQARVMSPSRSFPDEVIVGLNRRRPEWHDIYRLNFITGKLTLLLEQERFSYVLVDNRFRLRYAVQTTPNGAYEFYTPSGADWELWDTVPREDNLTTTPVGFDTTDQTLYLVDSRGRNTAALVAVDTFTKKVDLLADNPRADAADVLRHPTEMHVQAVAFNYERKQWVILDDAIQTDFAYLRTVTDGDLEIVSRTDDDRHWLAAFLVDDGPFRYYLYDRDTRTARFLFSYNRALEEQPLVKMHPSVIRSRDGLDLVAYYSLPRDTDADGDGVPDRPLPLVFIPHGGPWNRDRWGYSALHQWCANRGYAALSVNFRSSTGFGKAFVNAGDREWGGKILDDQQDAVRWAIEHGIADRTRVAVFGGSFGGYSALAGLTFTPEVFACGVDLVGPSNLITLLESMPPYWKPDLELFTTRVGDHRTEEGRALLEKHSPLTQAERVCRPLLIGQGANDPRVKQAESDQIVKAMQVKGLPVTYVLYPDEGHGFARPENRMSFNAIAEAFLAEHLGGRFEQIGDDFSGAGLEVPAGREYVPGLAAALKAHRSTA